MERKKALIKKIMETKHTMFPLYTTLNNLDSITIDKFDDESIEITNEHGREIDIEDLTIDELEIIILLLGQKIETETRVYIVSREDCELMGNDIEALTDEEFMIIAESTGKVHSLKGFQDAFNSIGSGIEVEQDYIRILTV